MASVIVQTTLEEKEKHSEIIKKLKKTNSNNLFCIILVYQQFMKAPRFVQVV